MWQGITAPGTQLSLYSTNAILKENTNFINSLTSKNNAIDHTLLVIKRDILFDHSYNFFATKLTLLRIKGI